MSTMINFRQDEEIAAQLRNLAERNQRTLTDELRSANAVYLALQELAELRVARKPGDIQSMFADWEVMKRLDVVLANALPRHVLAEYQADTGVDPTASVFQPFVPGNSLLGWVLGLDDHWDD